MIEQDDRSADSAASPYSSSGEADRVPVPVDPLDPVEGAGLATIRGQALRIAIGLGLILVLGKLSLAATDSLRELMVAREKVAGLEEQVRETEHRVEALHRTVDALENDPVALERIVRQELGYVRPDDTVIVLEERTRSRTP